MPFWTHKAKGTYGFGNVALGSCFLISKPLELTSSKRLIYDHITTGVRECPCVSSNLLPMLSAPDTQDHSGTSPVSPAAQIELGTERELSSYPGGIQ